MLTVETTKIKEKEAGSGHFLTNTFWWHHLLASLSEFSEPNRSSSFRWIISKPQFCFCGEGSFYSFLWYPWEREREEIVFISWTRVVPFPSPISQLSHSNVIRCFPFLAMMHTCSCSTHRTTSLKYYASIIIERQLVCFKLCIFTNLTSTGLYSKSSEALGERTGLVVIGGDSCTDDRGFESQHRILDGHIFTYICTINFNVDN